MKEHMSHSVESHATAEDSFFLPPRNDTKGLEIGLILIQGARSPVQGYKPMLEAIQAASSDRLWVGAPQHPLDIAEIAFGRKVDEMLQTMTKAPVTVNICEGVHTWCTQMVYSDSSSVSHPEILPPCTSQAGMKADRLVLMGHSLGAVCCQFYLPSFPGKFDALVLTGSTILRRFRNSSGSAPAGGAVGICD